MLSIVDLEPGPPLGEDALLDRVASAALERFVEYGIRRSTIDDIAQAAGVSRITVFRRFENKQRLIDIVIAREIQHGMAELDRTWSGGESLEEQLAQAMTFVVQFVRGHPLFDRLLRSEPESVLPLLTVDGGPAIALYRELIAHRLRTEIAAGRAASDDPDLVAEVIARLAVSLILTRDGLIAFDNPDSLVALARVALLPMLKR